ncbi:MAG: hypothetical protein KC503_44890 [Myxococcales bacterium]|nr:hypothetical protein [Myxococcales bacterium]
MPSPIVIVLTAVLAFASGCAAPSARVPARVGVFPLDGVGVERARLARLRAMIAQRAARATRVVAPEKIDAARTACGRPTSSPTDTATAACASRVGREVGASHIVIGAVGGVGKLVVLQMSLVGVNAGAVTRALEETVVNAAASPAAALGALTDQLLGVPRPTRWYERWWLWTLVGVGVTAAIVLPLALRRDDPYRPIQLP